MEGYYFSVKFGLLLILCAFLYWGLLPLSYWHIGFLGKKMQDLRKFLYLCPHFYAEDFTKPSHKNTQKDDKNRDK